MLDFKLRGLDFVEDICYWICLCSMWRKTMQLAFSF